MREVVGEAESTWVGLEVKVGLRVRVGEAENEHEEEAEVEDVGEGEAEAVGEGLRVSWLDWLHVIKGIAQSGRPGNLPPRGTPGKK